MVNNFGPENPKTTLLKTNLKLLSWSAQFIEGIGKTTGENFKQLSQRVNELRLSLFKVIAPQRPVPVILPVLVPKITGTGHRGAVNRNKISHDSVTVQDIWMKITLVASPMP